MGYEHKDYWICDNCGYESEDNEERIEISNIGWEYIEFIATKPEGGVMAGIFCSWPCVFEALRENMGIDKNEVHIDG